MAQGSLRRYDVQANYACGLAILSLLPLLAAAALVWRNYRVELLQIVYQSQKYLIVLHGCLFTAALAGVIAMILGWSSADQRRNEHPGRSWTGFFVGGFVLSFALILLIAFYMLRLERPA